jgi:hypothetical protein
MGGLFEQGSDRMFHLGLLYLTRQPYNAAMQKFNNSGIDASLAALVVDAILAQKGYSDHDELRILISQLRDDDELCVLDFSRKLAPVLLEIISDTLPVLVQRVSAGLMNSASSETDQEELLRTEATMAELKRISAVRLLGMLRDLRAENSLCDLVLETTAALSSRIIALHALLAVNASKALQVLSEIFSRPTKPVGVVCRLIFADEVIVMTEEQESEPELMIRQCLQLLRGMQGEQFKQLFIQVLQNRQCSLSLRQLAFNLLHASESSTFFETATLIKMASCLK